MLIGLPVLVDVDVVDVVELFVFSVMDTCVIKAIVEESARQKE